MTIIYRKLDLQTRQLVPINGSTSAGGTVNDSNMLTIVIDFDDQGLNYADFEKYILAFDVPDDNGNPYHVELTSLESNTRLKYKVPFSVMSRIKHNKLSYQLVLMKFSTTSETSTLALSDIDTIVMSDQDNLMICKSLLSTPLISSIISANLNNISVGGDEAEDGSLVYYDTDLTDDKPESD